MDASNPLVRTQQRLQIVKALLDADRPLSALQVAERAQGKYDTAREVLTLMEGVGWLSAPGQSSERRRGRTRYYLLTPQGRKFAKDFLA